MKNKKSILIIFIVISVIILAIAVGVIFGIIKSNNTDSSINTDSSLPESIPHFETSASQDKSEETVFPIKPNESDETEKADIEFDIGDHKPEIKDPSVGNVTVEYDTKEIEQ